ncbi:MAG: type I restriction-modification system subunit M [Anaerolineae bacterium]|nr:type I restriction-modification system subunit M [Anaerolineae bacterium]
MTGKINQNEINAILWKACDTFRGTIDPSEYKNYILVMLFVKYISDVWQDHYDDYESRFGGDEEKIRRRLEREKFVLPAGSTFPALYAQRNATNLGEVIDVALEAVEDANVAKLRGVFRNISFNSDNLGNTRQRNERLKNLLNDFNDPRLDMRPSRIGNLDIIGNAYEYLIGKFAADAGKKAGEFYTPPEVSELLARLVDPQPGDRICDPACGSGSLLIKCAQRVGDGNYSIYGQESNGSTWALAKMNMFLHDISNARLEWGDTLNEPRLVAGDRLMTFEVVVANPPFSLDKWGAERAAADRYGRYWRGTPPRSKGDYAFISHMIATMDATRGRVGVVVPHGVLFRGGAEGRIRRALIEENLLDAVVGLPPNLFYGTGIPAAILIFRRDRADDRVLFIDASREFEQGTNQNKLRPEDLSRIVATYRARESVERYAAVATCEEIAANDFNLNIPRYVDTYESEPIINLAEIQREIATIDRELVNVQVHLEANLEELGLWEKLY